MPTTTCVRPPLSTFGRRRPGHFRLAWSDVRPAPVPAGVILRRPQVAHPRHRPPHDSSPPAARILHPPSRSGRPFRPERSARERPAWRVVDLSPPRSGTGARHIGYSPFCVLGHRRSGGSAMVNEGLRDIRADGPGIFVMNFARDNEPKVIEADPRRPVRSPEPIRNQSGRARSADAFPINIGPAAEARNNRAHCEPDTTTRAL